MVSSELIFNLTEKGIRACPLRDEIYVQVIKQITKNPYAYYKINFSEHVVHGWTLLGILTATFPPSKDLENYLKSFIEANYDQGGHDSKMDIAIRYSFISLQKICRVGPRGRVHTMVELEQAIVKN